MRDDTADVLTQSKRSGATWEEIKQMDQACQKFTVVVEAKEESESEDEGAETTESKADIEDVSDKGIDDDDWGFDRSKKSWDEMPEPTPEETFSQGQGGDVMDPPPSVAEATVDEGKA
jgi:hypothetical protein